METIIEKEQNSASYTRQNKRKPIVLLDSSYLLNELLDRRKTADFLDVCHYIKNVSNAHIIFLKPISDETKYISRNHSHNPQVKEGFEILGTIKLHQPYLEGDQEEIFGILVKNITEKANGLALRMGKLPLSEMLMLYSSSLNNSSKARLSPPFNVLIVPLL